MSHKTRYLGYCTRITGTNGKIIEFTDVKYAKSKPTGQVQIIIHMDIGKPIIGTLHNVFFAPDLCDQLFYIIALMNL